MKLLILIKNLFFSSSIIVLATPVVQILVNNKPFEKNDRLQAGDKIKVECSTSDSNSFSQAMIISDGGTSISGYKKGPVVAEYTVGVNDGHLHGIIDVSCMASRDGKKSDDGKTISLKTQREPEIKINPAKSYSMKVLVNNKPFDKNNRLQAGDKIKVECSTSDSNSFSQAMIISDGGTSISGYKKGPVVAEHTVGVNDGHLQGIIDVTCMASRDGKKSDDGKNVSMRTQLEPVRNANPAKIGSMKVEVTLAPEHVARSHPGRKVQ